VSGVIELLLRVRRRAQALQDEPFVHGEELLDEPRRAARAGSRSHANLEHVGGRVASTRSASPCRAADTHLVRAGAQTSRTTSIAAGSDSSAASTATGRAQRLPGCMST